MKKILVACGTSDLGQGIITALLEGGHYVIATTNNETDNQKLLQHFQNQGKNNPNLESYVVNYTVENEVIEFSNLIQNKHNNIFAITNTCYYFWSGQRIIEMEMTEWHKIINCNITTFIHLVKYFVPLLDKSAKPYLININREPMLKPLPLALPMNVVANSYKAISETLSIELMDEGVKVVDLLVGTVATNENLEKKIASNYSYTPLDIGNEVLRLVNGFRPRTTTVKYLQKR